MQAAGRPAENKRHQERADAKQGASLLGNQQAHGVIVGQLCDSAFKRAMRLSTAGELLSRVPRGFLGNIMPRTRAHYAGYEDCFTRIRRARNTHKDREAAPSLPAPLDAKALVRAPQAKSRCCIATDCADPPSFTARRSWLQGGSYE